jgi:hypothetical protein
MKKARKIMLSKETLRSLQDLARGEDGPYGTETASITPKECYTASCRHIC